MMRSASAPASLMICGEHAVVHGEEALVAAVNRRLRLHHCPRSDGKIYIESALAQHHTDIQERAEHPRLRFVMAAIRRADVCRGFELQIESEIDPHLGLGSSAAVTAALVALLHPRETPDFWHAEALQVVREVQGRGSGADVAASLGGGLLAYFPREGNRWERLRRPPAGLSVRYAGYKTPTAEVLARLAARPAMEKARDAALYHLMGKISHMARLATYAEDWPVFYRQLNAYQELMAILGVCDAVQAQHVQEAQACSRAAKISGSGLGDCILAFADDLPPEHQPLEIDADGLQLSA